MRDADGRALMRAAVILLLISSARWSWNRRPSGLGPGSSSVLPVLLSESRDEEDAAARRARPLAAGETVDPNRAPLEDLDRLPGVGPATAEAMVASREEDGAFRTPEDLLRVRGIGPATLERIRPHLDLAVAPPATLRRAPLAVEDPAAPVDLNRADTVRLQELPGVGPALARRIVAARPFATVDDLARVRGIGPATLERLRPLLSVSR